MVTKRVKGSKRVKDLPAKSLSVRQSKKVKGGEIKPRDFVITHSVDKASPGLYTK